MLLLNPLSSRKGNYGIIYRFIQLELILIIYGFCLNVNIENNLFLINFAILL